MPGITIGGAVSPLQSGNSLQLSATLTEVSGPVSWSVNGVAGGNSAVGLITVAGKYTAPAVVPNPNTITVGATAMGVTGTASLTVIRPPATIASYYPYSLSTGAFTMSVGGNNFAPDVQIQLSGLTVTTQYQSPWNAKITGTVPAGLKITSYLSVTLPGPGGMTYTSSSGINVNGGGPAGGGSQTVSVSVSPSTANVLKGATQQFNASVSGNANTSVTWSVVGGGSISAAGLYTAPAVVPNPATVTVKATSVADNTKSASATVTIQEPATLPTISTMAPASLPLGPFTLTVNGTNFVNGAVVNVGGVALATTFVSSTQLTTKGVTTIPQQGSNVPVLVTNGGQTPVNSAAVSIPVGVMNPVVSASAAMRFLEQAGFGPRPADVMHLQQVGFQAWLNEQFALPTSQLFNAAGGGYIYDMSGRFINNASNAPDQLRQKLAFALHQLFVVSLVKLDSPTAVVPYQQKLYENAFTNYPALLKYVTLAPAMGKYLDMVNNDKADPVTGSVANENYAREILQLFSIGTVLLNNDGSPVIGANGRPVATYDQNTIAQFAKVFTGWCYAPQPGSPNIGHNGYNFDAPMTAWDPYHDTTAKTLLNGVVLPAGQSAQPDLDAALANIVAHQNVAPFIVKFLIQHFVTSNPSPAYMQRVVQVFNNGAVKGDMRAVISAILLDQEARAGDNGSVTAGFGHLQEPGLIIPNILRSFSATVDDGNIFNYELRQLSQNLYDSPSVFNYYTQLYQLPNGLAAPEFQIQTPWAAIYKINLFDSWFGAYQGTQATYGSGAAIDLSPWLAMAGNPTALVEALDATLTRGQMPATMKQSIISAVTGTSGDLKKVQVGTYLILTSAWYQVAH